VPVGCGAQKHQWDRVEVARLWLPSTPRCFVVGENPGNTASEYFYERPATYVSNQVAARRAILSGLQQQGLIADATRESFR
jgi:hypothetical protein